MITEPRLPTSWLLNGENLWNPRSVVVDHGAPGLVESVALSARTGIRLAARSGGPAAIDAPDGTWGGWRFPRRLCVDGGGRVVLLAVESEDRFSLRRFDADTQRFERIVPASVDQSAPFRRPVAITCGSSVILVADQARPSVWVLDEESMSTLARWSPRVSSRPWQPVDVAAWKAFAFVLDGFTGRIFRMGPGDSGFLPWAEPSPSDGPVLRWTGMLVDRLGRVIIQGQTAFQGVRLLRFDRWGRPDPIQSASPDADAMWDPSRLGDSLEQLDRAPTRFRRGKEGRLYFVLELPLYQPRMKSGQARLTFASDGEPLRLDPEDLRGEAGHARRGSWTSPRLDSGLPMCAWDKIEYQLISLPAGSSLEVRSYTTNEELEFTPPTELDLWDLCDQLASPEWDEERPALTERVEISRRDCLVGSREGRYLWLRFVLKGNTQATPAVGAIRARFPRESYVKLLPAVFSQDDESRRFLEQFLAVFQSEWEGLEQRVDTISGLFDPATAPGLDGLRYLADQLNLPEVGFERDLVAYRRFVTEAVKIEAAPGTVEGLRGLVRAWIYAGGGPSPELQARWGMPQVLEGFRIRRALIPTLNQPSTAELGRTAPLWGAERSGRFQFGGFSTLGLARLISTGEPALDPVVFAAHTVSVVVPDAWLNPSRVRREQLKAVIDHDAPAQLVTRLVPVGGAARLDLRGRLDLDAILGGPVPCRLADEADAGDLGSSPQGPFLGETTYLARDPQALTPRRRVSGRALGSETRLA